MGIECPAINYQVYVAITGFQERLVERSHVLIAIGDGILIRYGRGSHDWRTLEQLHDLVHAPAFFTGTAHGAGGSVLHTGADDPASVLAITTIEQFLNRILGAGIPLKRLDG